MYVIDQSACDGAPYKDSLEQDGYKSPKVSGVNSEFLAPFGASPPPVSSSVGPTMTKAAFFDAVRTRFGSDGSWRSGQNTGKTRATRGNGNGPAHESDHTGLSFFGSSKRARKSKISKPMVMLSSSTSVRTGFAERGPHGTDSMAPGKGKDIVTANFTLFGEGNNAGDIPRSGNTKIPLLPQARTDGSYPNGRILNSSPATPVLAYDRTRSNSDPARSSVHGSARTGGSPGKRQSGSASAPSLGTGIMVSHHTVSTDNIDSCAICSHTVGHSIYIRDG